MKTLILSVFALMVSATTFADAKITQVIGEWKSGNVTMTITSDSMTVDEKNNEGFSYEYSLTNNRIEFWTSVDDEMGWTHDGMTIVMIDKNTMKVKYDGEITTYTFKRKK